MTVEITCLVHGKNFFKHTGTVQHLVGLDMKCVNFKQAVYWKIKSIKDNYHILVFIKSILSMCWSFVVDSDKIRNFSCLQKAI